MNNRFLLPAVLIVVLSCQKEVMLPPLPYNPRVVIQGTVEPDSVPIVYFNRTVPYLSGTTDPAALVIRNASVTVSANGESDLLKLDSAYIQYDCKYSYFYRGSVRAKRNTVYTLTIVDSSKTYTATAGTFLTPVEIDSVSYTAAFKDLYGGHEGVITYFKDIAGEENYYRFEMVRPIYASVRDVTAADNSTAKPCIAEGDTILFREVGRSVYSDNNLQGQQMKLVIEPAITHQEIVEVTVRIQTIDKASFDFFDQIDGQKLAQYNPFVEPVFIRDGQFGRDAAGFFGSMIRSEEVVFEMPIDD
jgi:hypothetical protein